MDCIGRESCESAIFNFNRMHQIVDIKPLSVNEVWKGRRFKTKTYSSYEKEVLLKLKTMQVPPPPYEITFRFGLSSKLADWDNPVKPFQDILQKKYGFDDKHIERAVVEKVLVNKGDEFVEFELKTRE